MARDAGHTASAGTSTIAIHDYGDVAGQGLQIDLRKQIGICVLNPPYGGKLKGSQGVSSVRDILKVTTGPRDRASAFSANDRVSLSAQCVKAQFIQRAARA